MGKPRGNYAYSPDPLPDPRAYFLATTRLIALGLNRCVECREHVPNNAYSRWAHRVDAHGWRPRKR